MIIWLASYPKSGNTWMRAIISALIHSKNGVFNFNLLKQIKQFPEKKYFKDLIKDFSDFNEIKENWILAQEKINLNNEIKFLKTHHGKYTVEKNNFTNDKNTLATIYIVRDPRTLVSSISNHYSISNNDAANFLLDPSMIGNSKSFEDKQDGMLTLLGKWNDHYRSWTRNKNNLLIIRYEDLISNPKTELIKLIVFLKKYIKFQSNEEKNQNILNTTSFKNLKEMEKKGLFLENVINKDTKNNVDFFHLGPKNNWQDILDKKIIDKIEKNFSLDMKEIGYI